MRESEIKKENAVKKILMVGMYDTETVSLAPRILKSFAQTVAGQKGMSIETIEFSIFEDDVDDMVSKISRHPADVVGFSAYIWNIGIIEEIIKKLNSIILVGGPQVTGIEKKLLNDNPHIDIVVTGEGEETFKQLIEYFAGEKKLQDIRGITTRDLQTDPRPVLKDLDDIPAFYQEIAQKHKDLTWICLETSRGCPVGCKYCTWSSSRKMRYHSVDRVKQDLDRILSMDKLKEIYLCDSNILINKERGREILEYIGSKNKEAVIRFEFDPIMLDDASIELLNAISQNEFNFGIQTVNKRALDIIGKKFDRDRFESIYRKILQKIRNPLLTIDLIYGLPGDNIEGYTDSLEYALGFVEVKRILTNPLIVLPGSAFFQNMEHYKIKLRDERSYIIRENETFSQADMETAKKYSFYVYTLYFNDILRKCMRSYAETHGNRFMDIIIDFFESLTFDITGGNGFPYTIPSIKEGFLRRNRVIKTLAKNYADIVECFDHYSNKRFKTELADFQKGQTEYFAKMKRLASK